MCLTWKHTPLYIHMLLWRLLANRQLCLEYLHKEHMAALRLFTFRWWYAYTSKTFHLCVVTGKESQDYFDSWQNVTCHQMLFCPTVTRLFLRAFNSFQTHVVDERSHKSSWCEILIYPFAIILDISLKSDEWVLPGLTWNQVPVVCFKVGQSKMTGRFCSRKGNNVFPCSQY